MVFSSLAEFEKWHKSIQYRYNAGAQNGLPSPGGRTKAVAQHTRRASSRPHASQLRKPQTGATLPPFRCDIQGPRLTKKQKGPHFDIPSGIKSGSNPSVSPYPPVRYEWEAED